MIKNMDDNFKKLPLRVLDSLEKSDLNKIQKILSSIDGPTLVSGVGGSSVVSNFLKKVLESKNNILCENVTARDCIYKNINAYQNIITCSYSGKNFGVDTSFNNTLNQYLLSKNKIDGVTNIRYIADREYSFIALSATLIPMTIILAYYLDNDLSITEEILKSSYEINIKTSNIYEVLTGYDTSTASKFIESTLIESGIGIPIIHDKYEYCHGRSTLGYHFDSNLIFLNTESELDHLYKKNLKDYYSNIIELTKKYEDTIINDYYFTYLSMLLCKQIAESKKKDLSNVDYSPFVKKLYYFKGEM